MIAPPPPSPHLRPLTCWCCHGQQRIHGVMPSLQMAGRCERARARRWEKVSGCDSVVTLRLPLFNSPLPCLRRRALLFAERLHSSSLRAAAYCDSAALMQLDNRGLGSDLATFPRPPPSPPPRLR